MPKTAQAEPVSPPVADAEPPPEAFRAWLSVARAYNLCDAVMARRLSPLGLRIVDHQVLLNVMTAPGITQQQLAARCFVAKSGVSMLLKRMELLGWVRREADATDARAWRLSLTRKGLALARKAHAVQTTVVVEMTESSSAADLDRVAGSMDAVAAILVRMR